MEEINVLLSLMLIVSFLLAIVLHEFAHALMASWLGDHTPQAEGRRSLSFRSHIDAVGLLMCIILAFQPVGTFPAGFGWGKPVKADPWKMRVGANTGLLAVACFGPIFSLIIGLLMALVVRVVALFLVANVVTVHLLQFLLVFAVVNVSLMLFNLIPLYPLDGYQILYTLLPSKQAIQFSKSAPYGPFIILAVFFFLPFLARFSGPAMSSFPLFRLAYYILLGSFDLVALALGHFPGSFNLVYSLYQL